MIEKINQLTLKRILSLSTLLFILNLIFFSFFLIRDIFFNPKAQGDEDKYLKDLLLANESGIARAAAEGASFIFLSFSYVVDKFTEAPFLSLKITSLFFGVLTFVVLIYFNKRFLKIKGDLKIQVFLWILYLFVIQTTSFSAVNDIVLDFFGVCFFMFFLVEKKENVKKFSIMGFFLALMLATRTMAATFIIVFFLVFSFFTVIFKNHPIYNFKNNIILGFSTLFFLILVNSYNLYEFHRFSFEDKPLPGAINWAQWDYHNALLIDQGLQKRSGHVSIAETELYLKKNGKTSLPSNFFEMIIFDPILTIKEFFVDAATGMKYMVRQTGLLSFLFCIFLFLRIKYLWQKKEMEPKDFLYFFCAFYFLFMCFIVVTNIQSRWFMLFLPLMILLIGKDLNDLDYKKQMIFAISNNFLFVAMTLPYILKKMPPFF